MLLDYKDQLKKIACTGSQTVISHQLWQQEDSDRDSWHSPVRTASLSSRQRSMKPQRKKRRGQKERTVFRSSSTQTFVCPKCSRVCASRIGLFSHQRACKNWPPYFLKILDGEESAIKLAIPFSLCVLAVCIEVNLLIPFSVSLGPFQGHSSIVLCETESRISLYVPLLIKSINIEYFSEQSEV